MFSFKIMNGFIASLFYFIWNWKFFYGSRSLLFRISWKNSLATVGACIEIFQMMEEIGKRESETVLPAEGDTVVEMN